MGVQERLSVSPCDYESSIHSLGAHSIIGEEDGRDIQSVAGEFGAVHEVASADLQFKETEATGQDDLCVEGREKGSKGRSPSVTISEHIGLQSVAIHLLLLTVSIGGVLWFTNLYIPEGWQRSVFLLVSGIASTFLSLQIARWYSVRATSSEFKRLRKIVEK